MTVSLTDLLSAAKRAEIVEVLGAEVDCRSLTLAEIADLIWRFPEVRRMMREAAAQQEDGEATSGLSEESASRLLALAPKAIGAVIAAGTGHAGEQDQEAAATQLPLDAQVELLATILRLSAPGGVVPLVQKVTAALTGRGVVAAASGKALDMTLPPPSNGSSASDTA